MRLMGSQPRRWDSRGLTSPAPGGVCWLLSKVVSQRRSMYASEGLAYGFLLLAGAILLGFLFVVPARAHDWYGGLMSPITAGSCCSEKDCHPVSAAPDDEGAWWVYEDGRRKRVPERAILNMTAPDGNSHVCESNVGIVCFIRGVPKS